jgi:hypothetical protein
LSGKLQVNRDGSQNPRISTEPSRGVGERYNGMGEDGGGAEKKEEIQ